MADRERTELEPVDLSTLVFTDADEFPADYDPNDNVFDQAPPIPDGSYRFKLRLADTDPLESWTDKESGREIRATIVAEVTQVISVPKEYAQDELEGAIVFATVNTVIPRGKHGSTMGGLLKELGQDKRYEKSIGPLPTKKAALVELFAKVMAMEPTIVATTEWQAWEEAKGKLRCVKRGMTSFPRLQDGKHSPVTKGQTGDVNAKTKIKSWLGVNSEQNAKAQGKVITPLVSHPNPARAAASRQRNAGIGESAAGALDSK
jgi:hypothetical protein